MPTKIRLRSVRVALFLLIILSAPGAHAEWLEASTDHFLIYANAKEEWMRDYATTLERFDRGLLQGRRPGAGRIARRPPAHAAGRAEGGETPVRDFARNKKALADFNIEETYEAGISLTGPEVKSVRDGRAGRRL